MTGFTCANTLEVTPLTAVLTQPTVGTRTRTLDFSGLSHCWLHHPQVPWSGESRRSAKQCYLGYNYYLGLKFKFQMMRTWNRFKLNKITVRIRTPETFENRPKNFWFGMQRVKLKLGQFKVKILVNALTQIFFMMKKWTFCLVSMHIPIMLSD